MTPEVQEYYESFFTLFATKGWKQFLEELEKAKESLTIEQAETIEGLYHFKGQLFVVNNALGFEDMMRNAYDEIVESEKTEQDD